MVSRSLRFWATTLTSGACDVSQDARRSAREEIVFHVRGERWGEMAEGHYGSHSSFATAGMLVLIQNFRSHRPRRHLGWRICTVHEARPTTLDMASRTAVNEGDIKKWKKRLTRSSIVSSWSTLSGVKYATIGCESRLNLRKKVEALTQMPLPPAMRGLCGHCESLLH